MEMNGVIKKWTGFRKSNPIMGEMSGLDMEMEEIGEKEKTRDKTLIWIYR
jgi:hypothetical protein